jgi:DNA topoisomerase-1
VLGKHPANGGEIKVMAGRFGPYVTDGTTNATLPRGADPKAITLDEAVRLIDERAAKGPPAKKGRRPARGKKK